MDGEAYVGEFLYPGNDCSDILNREQDADDGFYWITLKTATKRKVCTTKSQSQSTFMHVKVRPDLKSLSLGEKITYYNNSDLMPHWLRISR